MREKQKTKKKVFRKIRAVKQKLALLYPEDVAAAQQLYRPPAIPDDDDDVDVNNDDNDNVDDGDGDDGDVDVSVTKSLGGDDLESEIPS
jgi:hypothetical protein